jgi:hypothetical protein
MGRTMIRLGPNCQCRNAMFLGCVLPEFHHLQQRLPLHLPTFAATIDDPLRTLLYASLKAYAGLSLGSVTSGSRP